MTGAKQTDSPVRTRRDPGEAERRREVLKQRAAKLPASAMSEAEVFRHCESAARRVLRSASDDERCAVASEVAERVFRTYGVALANGWRVPREVVSPLLLDHRTRDQVKRSAVWRDVEEDHPKDVERWINAEHDDWNRERVDWIAPTHGVDSAELAERVASRFPQQQRATVARFLLAASEASRGPDGTATYGPGLAERCGCSLATLRQAVKRGREYVARIDPSELAEWIAAERDHLADLERAARLGPVRDPREVAAERAHAAVLAAERRRPAKPERWTVAGRACSIAARRVTYRPRAANGPVGVTAGE